MTDNMNIMTDLYSTSSKIESVEIMAVLSIHLCTCEINSYKRMFLAHGVLYYRPNQRSCDFLNLDMEAFDVLNILNVVIY